MIIERNPARRILKRLERLEFWLEDAAMKWREPVRLEYEFRFKYFIQARVSL